MDSRYAACRLRTVNGALASSLSVAANYIGYTAAAIAIVYDSQSGTSRYLCSPPTDPGFVFPGGAWPSPTRQSRKRVDSDSSIEPKGRLRVKPLVALDISANGKYLAVGESGYAPRILIYNLEENAKDPIVVQAHTHGVQLLSFSANSEYLVSLGFIHDGGIHVWAITSDSAVKFASNRVTSKVRTLQWLGNAIIVAGLRHVKVFGFPLPQNISIDPPLLLEGRNVVLNELAEDDFTCMAPLDSGHCILASSSGSICVLNVEDRVVKRCTIVDFSPTSVSFSNKDLLIMGSSTGFITYSVHENGRDISLSRAHKTEHILPILKIVSNELPSRMIDCKVTGSGTVVCAYNNKSIQMITPQQNYKVQWLAQSHPGTLQGVEICDGLLLTWSSNGHICMWDPESLQKQSSFQLSLGLAQKRDVANQLCAVGFISVNHLVTGDLFGNLMVIDLCTTATIWSTLAHTREISLFAVSPDKKLLISASRDRTMQVFVSAGKGHWRLIQTLSEHTATINAVQFVDEDRIVSCGSDKTFIIRSKQQDCRNEFSFIVTKSVSMKSSVMDFCIRQESDYIIATSDRQFQVHNREGVFLESWRVDGEAIEKMEIGPKGFLACAGMDRTIQIRSTRTGEMLASGYGHTDAITGLRWLTETTLLSVGLDSVMIIWVIQFVGYSVTVTPLRRVGMRPELTRSHSTVLDKRLHSPGLLLSHPSTDQNKVTVNHTRRSRELRRSPSPFKAVHQICSPTPSTKVSAVSLSRTASLLQDTIENLRILRSSHEAQNLDAESLGRLSAEVGWLGICDQTQLLEKYSTDLVDLVTQKMTVAEKVMS